MGTSEAMALRPAKISEEEWKRRLELAALYHLFDFLGWTEGIFNHISLRVPGPGHHYLMNPFGLNYNEVTASNLIKVDVAGNLVEPSPYPGNPAGFAIHGVIHESREDAQCVIHTHTTAGLAVACKDEGMTHDDFYGAQLYGQVAYHEFEGVTVRQDERERLKKSLGERCVLILRNHGLLVVGPDLPTAFRRYWAVQRACEVQYAAASMRGPNRILSDAVRLQSQVDQQHFDADGRLAQAVFDAAVRRMEMARARRFVDFRT
jgi:ribulose-5-phosphate 4-epimerase/fuculose-1-phosphate aldolase